MVDFADPMAGVTILPSDPWPRSNVTEEVLRELVGDGLLRPVTNLERPEWIVPAYDEEEPRPWEGYVVSFVVFHQRGFGMLVSRFMRALLRNYEVELHNFTPNSIAQAAIFVAVYEGYMGIAPHWDLWLHLFRAETSFQSSGEKGVKKAVRAGGCTLQLRQEHSHLYIPAKLSKSNKGWQEWWFYL